ncbi:hypothetical protein LEP1GSC040_3408 [Leptospira santarosai str. 2000030832]|nr:hypothetical protein LEP1GSC040_3408 [Leptospira santarosai str. 2000030832]
MPSFFKITRPLTLFAELNDTALYGSQRQVLGHAVKILHRIFRKTTVWRFSFYEKLIFVFYQNPKGKRGSSHELYPLGGLSIFK